MVKHQPLQVYERQLCLSCITGIYGCRWKRYQRSHDDTTKVRKGGKPFCWWTRAITVTLRLFDRCATIYYPCAVCVSSDILYILTDMWGNRSPHTVIDRLMDTKLHTSLYMCAVSNLSAHQRMFPSESYVFHAGYACWNGCNGCNFLRTVITWYGVVFLKVLKLVLKPLFCKLV